MKRLSFAYLLILLSAFAVSAVGTGSLTLDNSLADADPPDYIEQTVSPAPVAVDWPSGVPSTGDLPETVVDDAIKDVTVTMYNGLPGQTDDSPTVTATGHKFDPNNVSHEKIVAVSRDLLRKNGGPYEMGDSIRLSGTGDKDGTYVIKDKMGKRWQKRIDILEDISSPLYKYTGATLTRS